MNYHSSFISAAANTVGQGSCWINHGGDNTTSFIAYAASNFVAIVDDEKKAVVHCLRGGKIEDNIITLSSISTKQFGMYIVCGFQSGNLLLWKCEDLHSHKWRKVVEDSSLTSSINALSSVELNDGIIVTAFDASGAGRICFYNYESETMTLHQSFKFPPHQLPNSCHLSLLSENIPLLIIGGVDGKVYLYTSDNVEKISFVLGGVMLGHEEWITCLCSKDIDPKTKFIASGSQDTKIRLWKILEQGSDVKEDVYSSESKIVDIADDNDEDEEEDEEEGDKPKTTVVTEDENELSSEARFAFLAGGRRFLVFLESLLVGHEDWVTSIHWMPGQALQLFSTSMDRNMVIWAPDTALGGVWTPIVRVGDVGGALGGCIGGNLLGFVGGCAAPSGEAILGIGYGGSFHYWKRRAVGANDERWAPVPFITGHFESVNDLAWDPTGGRYLITVSADQTCRLFAPVVSAQGSQWRELSRPEIHGYNLNCLALSKSSFHIYTGGEEKVIRVFDAPNSVLRGLQQLCGMSLEYDASSRVEQAYIPELGLSNKAKDSMSAQEKKELESRGVEAISWSQPPLESQLSDNTLWLETKKMFGHNNEVVTMKMSKDGQWLASSSKARYSQSCHVIVWSTTTKELASRLEGHESTVACLDFSDDGKYLASSGKDRSLCIYCATGDAKNPYTLAICLKNSHKRIVWDCSWIPNSHVLITVARDGVCKVWQLTELEDGTLDIKNLFSWQPFDGIPVTAIAVYDEPQVNGRHLVAVGSEEGKLQLCLIDFHTPANNVKLGDVPVPFCHGKAVKRIEWRPKQLNSQHLLEFATCGEDNSVRIHGITLP